MSAESAAVVLEILARQGKTLATAESLTGGLLAEMITAVPGASRVFRGGVIAYATELKATLAGVAPSTLDDHGAVAAETAAEMACGVAAKLGADWGLATTGVAGPDRQEGHPVGTVFVAAAGPAGTEVATLALSGTRGEIRAQAAEAAIGLLQKLCDRGI